MLKNKNKIIEKCKCSWCNNFVDRSGLTYDTDEENPGSKNLICYRCAVVLEEFDY